MNIDEIDFFDLRSDSAAFMHLVKPDGEGISIEFAVVKDRGLEVTVSLEDARRLAERLLAAIDEVASER